ncbi:hypothetical protein [Fimbriimonas ginsengisoli]|uniref:Uncharacterized protein n=1 Tax=Fimbriimonas ginsengisoli Gsoil 348 TaxID=661478 RepID=A0A068NVW8_FIMGI|nr:hypothetical protein [Fimbriimonas ginsengisoli]AIE87507.1 hypothetical protein OP10G_4139 [Fimbriimonas ginsengisoli Gsoil 348]
MFFCLRIDLDYVPWDTPDATEFGHGEPAALLRILDLARYTGFKFHFFVSNRVLRAFPANAEAALNDGHDLDWLCKHPEAAEARFHDARALFSMIGHVPVGMAVRGAWPANGEEFDGIEQLAFLSAAPGLVPKGLKLFPVETRAAREATRAGMSARAWTDVTKTQLREAASRNFGLTLIVRPQVLARFDPKLSHLKEILDFARALDLPVQTLRDSLRSESSSTKP